MEENKKEITKLKDFSIPLSTGKHPDIKHYKQEKEKELRILEKELSFLDLCDKITKKEDKFKIKDLKDILDSGCLNHKEHLSKKWCVVKFYDFEFKNDICNNCHKVIITCKKCKTQYGFHPCYKQIQELNEIPVAPY